LRPGPPIALPQIPSLDLRGRFAAEKEGQSGEGMAEWRGREGREGKKGEREGEG